MGVREKGRDGERDIVGESDSRKREILITENTRGVCEREREMWREIL